MLGSCKWSHMHKAKIGRQQNCNLQLAQTQCNYDDMHHEHVPGHYEHNAQCNMLDQEVGMSLIGVDERLALVSLFSCIPVTVSITICRNYG